MQNAKPFTYPGAAGHQAAPIRSRHQAAPETDLRCGRIFFFRSNIAPMLIERASGLLADALVVAGSDPVRLARFIRSYLPLFSRKAKLALTVATLPGIRARLLNAGFDDVFDLSTRIEECLARVAALHRRLAPDTGMALFDELMERHLLALVRETLTRREAHLLAQLLAAKGGIVRTGKLETRKNRWSFGIDGDSLIENDHAEPWWIRSPCSV